MAKTTKKDFEIFKKEVRKWKDILGLQDWEICCIHGGADGDSRANYLTNIAGRICTIFLTDDWDGCFEEKTERAIKQIAFHEVVELTLQDLRVYALYFINAEFVEEATHKIVRMLENVLFPKY